MCVLTVTSRVHCSYFYPVGISLYSTPLYGKFRRPIFHITVLFIDKEESVKRQLRRGQLALIHNQMVKTTGVGELKQVRETDLDPQLAEYVDIHSAGRRVTVREKEFIVGLCTSYTV